MAFRSGCQAQGMISWWSEAGLHLAMKALDTVSVCTCADQFHLVFPSPNSPSEPVPLVVVPGCPRLSHVVPRCPTLSHVVPMSCQFLPLLSDGHWPRPRAVAQTRSAMRRLSWRKFNRFHWEVTAPSSPLAMQMGCLTLLGCIPCRPSIEFLSTSFN